MDSITNRPLGVGRRKVTSKSGDGLAGFYVMVNGQVESAEFRGLDNMFCRYTFSYGPDWRIVQGVDHGYSQVAQKASSSEASIVWNFPLDVTFKATNAHGWPRLVISVYSQDFFGRYVIRGYGSVLIPTVPGRYVRYVRTFAPVSSTYFQAFLGWMTGHLPEFYDSRFVASNEGREVVRVASTGVVRVQFNVMSRGMHSHGYATGGPPDAPDLDAEAAFVAGGGMPGLGAQAMPAPTSRWQDTIAAVAANARRAQVSAAFSGTAAGASAASGASASTETDKSKPPLHGAEGKSSDAASSRGRDKDRVGSSSDRDKDREGSVPTRVHEVEPVGPGGESRDRSGSRARDRDSDKPGRSSSRRRLAAVDEDEDRAGATGSSRHDRDRDGEERPSRARRRDRDGDKE